MQACASADESSRRRECLFVYGCAFVRMGTLRHQPSHQLATLKHVSGRGNFNVEMGTMISTFKCGQEAEPIEEPPHQKKKEMMDQLLMRLPSHCERVSVCVG